MDPWLGNWSRLRMLPDAAKNIKFKKKEKRYRVQQEPREAAGYLVGMVSCKGGILVGL